MTSQVYSAFKHGKYDLVKNAPKVKTTKSPEEKARKEEKRLRRAQNLAEFNLH